MIISFGRYRPKLHKSVFVAPGAYVIGRVAIGRSSSIWFNAVLRGDIDPITIGDFTNIQDGSILHTAVRCPCRLGDHVHVGHHVNLHGCTVRDGALIGIGAIVLNGAVIGEEAMVGAGAVVPEGMRVAPRTLVLGVPARFARRVTRSDIADTRYWCRRYTRLAALYRRGTA